MVIDAATEAELEAARAVLDASGVQTRIPAPGWGDWLNSVLVQFGEALSGFLQGLFGPLPAFLSADVIGWTLLALLLAACFGLILYAVRSRRSTTKPDLVFETVAGQVSHDADTEDFWRQLFEQRLAGGELRPALEALWQWLARRLVPQKSDTVRTQVWTGRELLTQSRRSDLRDLVTQLERLSYAGEPITKAQVENAYLQLSERVAQRALKVTEA